MTSPVKRLLLAALLSMSATCAVQAEPVQVRFRGTVVRAEADRLEIRRPSGSTLAMRMTQIGRAHV